MKCVVYECMYNEEKRLKSGFVPPKIFKTFFGFIEDTMTKTGDGIYYRSLAID